MQADFVFVSPRSYRIEKVVLTDVQETVLTEFQIPIFFIETSCQSNQRKKILIPEVTYIYTSEFFEH
jgi:hypothetical protein